MTDSDYEKARDEKADHYGPNESVCHTQRLKPAWVYSVSDFKAGADWAREYTLNEKEYEFVIKLAAISTASIQNTRKTIKDRIGKDNPYFTVAYSDVCNAIDREIKQREQLDAKTKALEVAKHKIKKAIVMLEATDMTQCCRELRNDLAEIEKLENGGGE